MSASAQKEFQTRKKQILASLDKSPKGSLDAPILEFLNWLNEQPAVVTTSSCSGRHSVFFGSSDPSESKGGEWLVVSHDPIPDGRGAWNEIVAKLDAKDAVTLESSLVTFLLEPFVLHAECEDVSVGQTILQVAREVGFRESGLSVGKKRVLVQIRTLALRLEVPLFLNGTPLVQADYFETLIELGNARLAENKRRTDKLWHRLREVFEGGAEAKEEDEELWVLIAPTSMARGLKVWLEALDWMDESRKMGPARTVEEDAAPRIALPLTPEGASRLRDNRLPGEQEVEALAERLEKARKSGQKPKKNKTTDKEEPEPVDLLALWRQGKVLELSRSTDEAPTRAVVAPQVDREREKLAESLCQAVEEAVKARGAEAAKLDLTLLFEQLREMLPRLQWRGDVALLPRGALTDDCWASLASGDSDIWDRLRRTLGARLLGRQQEIGVDDAVRGGAVAILAGSGSGWVVVPGPRDVRYTLDITRCMFSEGNAEEKARVRDWKVEGETILDMYTGIGFWTLPMLAAGAAKVISCEWNPDAVEALRAGLKLMGPTFEARCEVMEGDNRRPEVRRASERRCHRVVLGLIPHSRGGFENAVEALRDEGGTLHVHWNAPASEETQIAASIAQELEALFLRSRSPWVCSVEHIQRVKWFAPRIRHLRIDVKCTPASTPSAEPSKPDP